MTDPYDGLDAEARKAAAEAERAERREFIRTHCPGTRIEGPEGSTLWATRNLQDHEPTPTFSSSWNEACKEEGRGEGIPLGWLSTALALQGSGKTTLAFDVAFRWACCGQDVHVIATETRPYRWIKLLYARYGITGSSWSQDLQDRVHNAMRDFKAQGGGQITVHNTTNPYQATEIIRWAHGERGTKRFVVDYLQGFGIGSEGAERQRAISNTVISLANLRDQLGVTAFLTSQVRREVSQGNNRRITASDAQWTSDIEHLSDQVLAIDHTRNGLDHYDKHLQLTFLHLLKNRHGPPIPKGFPIEINHITKTLREGKADELYRWPQPETKQKKK